MRLEPSQAREFLEAHSHGFMATFHPKRGIDVGPTVYAAANGLLGSPIDLVKPKTSVRLQRERNLEYDPRASIAIERWDRDDWTQLWWVRARLRWLGPDGGGHADAFAERLSGLFVQYRNKPFAAIHMFEITSVMGWSASENPEV